MVFNKKLSQFQESFLQSIYNGKEIATVITGVRYSEIENFSQKPLLKNSIMISFESFDTQYTIVINNAMVVREPFRGPFEKNVKKIMELHFKEIEFKFSCKLSVNNVQYELPESLEAEFTDKLYNLGFKTVSFDEYKALFI